MKISKNVLGNMRKICFSFLLLLVIFGCSPQKRIQRIVSKHPELLQKDTIKISDTTIIPGIAIDTVFITSKTDTIVFWKDNIKVQIIRSFDTLRTEITSSPDTIIKNINVPVDRIVIKNDSSGWWIKYLIIFVGLLILFLIHYYLL